MNPSDAVSPEQRPTIGPGVTLGHYRLLEEIGAGSFGMVFRAVDENLERDVAIKVLISGTLRDDVSRKRFRGEALILSRLNHPNIEQIFDFCTERGVDFIVMEYVPGTSLDVRLKTGALPQDEVLPLAQQLARGLSFAHSRHIIHRDLKPGNLRVTPEGVLKILDFGLAQVLATAAETLETKTLNQVPNFAGTLAYMSPEQLQGETPDVRSDVYAAGVVLYELVTGRLPYAARGQALIEEIISRTPVSPRSLAKTTSPELARIVLRCLEKRLCDRYGSAEDLLADLQQVEVGAQTRTFALNSVQLLRYAGILCITALLGLGLVYGTSGRVRAVFKNLISSLHLRTEVQSATAFAARDWILLTDFKNETKEPNFDRSVRDLLGQALSQSSYVNVVSRLTAVEAAKRTGAADPTHIDATLGRQICLREGYRGMLTGAITQRNSQYHIQVTLEDPINESVVLTDSEEVQAPEEIYVAADRLALRVRERLGESLKSATQKSKPLAQVTTPSLEALRRYSQALDLFGNHEYLRCVRLAQDAVNLDPHFAMAHLLLARAYDSLGNEAQSREEFRLARLELPHASEREQHLIVASDDFSQERLEEAAQEYQHILDLYPDDIDALRGFAESAYWSGRITDATNAQRKALDLSRNSITDYVALMTILVRAGEFDEALAVYAQARSHELDTLELRFVAALAAWGKGDLESARTTFSSFLENNGEYWRIVGYLWTGKLLTFEGRMEEANRYFSSGLMLVQQPERSDWVPGYQYMAARTAILRGDRSSAVDETTKLVDAAKAVPTPENLQRAGRLAVEVGDIKTAESIKRILEQKALQSNNLFISMHLFTLKGDLDMAYHRYDLAIQDSRRALAFRQGFEPYLVLGHACERAHDWQCAIISYKTFLGLKGSVLRDDYPADWVLANYCLARTYVSAGRREEGLKQYETFLSLFAAADKGLPSVVKAEEEVARLKAESASAEAH